MRKERSNWKIIERCLILLVEMDCLASNKNECFKNSDLV